MFRPLRLVMIVISMAVGLGMMGLRLSPPTTANAFGGGAPSAAMDNATMAAAMQLYMSIYQFANSGSQGAGWMGTGTPKYSNTEMGRGLANLRASQTGVVGGVHSHKDLVNQVESALKGMDMKYFGGKTEYRPPTAAVKRLRVGD